MNVSHVSLGLGHARALRATVLLAAGALCSCAATPTAQFQAFDGASLPQESIATLRFEPSDFVKIDGRPIFRGKYSSAAVLPGRHVVEWTHTFLVSVTVDPRMRASYTAGPANVVLDAGHSYRLRSERTFGFGYRVFFRIEDTDTGAVVWPSINGASPGIGLDGRVRSCAAGHLAQTKEVA